MHIALLSVPDICPFFPARHVQVLLEDDVLLGNSWSHVVVQLYLCVLVIQLRLTVQSLHT